MKVCSSCGQPLKGRHSRYCDRAKHGSKVLLNDVIEAPDLRQNTIVQNLGKRREDHG